MITCFVNIYSVQTHKSFSSTTLISSPVRQYNSLTSRSISRSVDLISRVRRSQGCPVELLYDYCIPDWENYSKERLVSSRSELAPTSLPRDAPLRYAIDRLGNHLRMRTRESFGQTRRSVPTQIFFHARINPCWISICRITTRCCATNR